MKKDGPIAAQQIKKLVEMRLLTKILQCSESHEHQNWANKYRQINIGR